MRTLQISVRFFLGVALSAQVARNQEVPLKNWQAPLYWQPSQAEADIRTPVPHAATPAGSLVFVAMTPCRVVDTRASQGFPNPFGPPSLSAGPARSFPLQSSSQCTIPSIAQAYSVIVTLVPPGPVGYLTMWPTGQTQPTVVTLDDLPGDIRQTGAVIPAGTPNGAISAVVSAVTDLVIDINGYYAPSTGITLAQGTVSAPSLSFAGDPGTGIYSSGMGVLNFTIEGEYAGSIGAAHNTAFGLVALANNTSGNTNTAIGDSALTANTSGSGNTAVGWQALTQNMTGVGNVATGSNALFGNIIGSGNTATGSGALVRSSSGSSNTGTGQDALAGNTTGSYNTADGDGALEHNFSGVNNTAIGYQSLQIANSTSNNTALGYMAGVNITTGSNNIHIGNAGTSTDGANSNTGVIRIGTSGTQTSFFAAGIAGAMVSGSPVLVDAVTGQLGTASSSRRYKEDIQDMSDASSALLRLRPVTFRYQKPYADGSKPLDYGLIAEEVAEVYPDLVIKNKDGQVETVQYQKLIPMLLNEVQKDHETIRLLQAQVAALLNQ